MSGVPGSNPQISNIVIDMNANGYRLPTEAEGSMPARVELSLTFSGKNLNDYHRERRSQRSKQLCRVAGKLP